MQFIALETAAFGLPFSFAPGAPGCMPARGPDSTPPSAFNDVFTSKLEFAGTVDGAPTVADITYRGTTQVGGDIDALMIASNGLRGVLNVDAVVAIGGSYEGFLRPKKSD